MSSQEPKISFIMDIQVNSLLHEILGVFFYLGNIYIYIYMNIHMDICNEILGIQTKSKQSSLIFYIPHIYIYTYIYVLNVFCAPVFLNFLLHLFGGRHMCHCWAAEPLLAEPSHQPTSVVLTVTCHRRSGV